MSLTGRPFGIGDQKSLPAPAYGLLYLTVNDDQKNDNAGERAPKRRPRRVRPLFALPYPSATRSGGGILPRSLGHGVQCRHMDRMKPTAECDEDCDVTQFGDGAPASSTAEYREQPACQRP